MDLHDYSDVAENYDKYLEVMYSDFDAHEGFQDFYLELAKKYGQDGVIDVACGTGAVLLYLARHGVIADGTDLSEEMCRVCREKAAAQNLKLRIFPGNMTSFDAGKIIGERVRPLTMRQTYRWEMFLLAELCGFEVVDIYRGYKGDKEDLNDPNSAAKYKSNLIWILRKK